MRGSVPGVAESRAACPAGPAGVAVIGQATEHVLVQAADHLGQPLLAAEHAHRLRQATQLLAPTEI